jgi:hypothetical protein
MFPVERTEKTYQLATAGAAAVNDKLNIRPNVALVQPAPAFFFGSDYNIQLFVECALGHLPTEFAGCL